MPNNVTNGELKSDGTAVDITTAKTVTNAMSPELTGITGLAWILAKANRPVAVGAITGVDLGGC